MNPKQEKQQDDIEMNSIQQSQKNKNPFVEGSEYDNSPKGKNIVFEIDGVENYEEDIEQEQGLLTYDKDEIISIRNVHKTYLLGVEGVTALRGVSFDVKEGEFIIILGTSGGGKTTLLNIMGTIDKPTKGDVFICGQKIKSSTQDKFLASLRLVRLGFVFQTFNLISSLTAIENVELPMVLRGKLSKAQIRKRAIELLEKVGLKERMHSFPNMLSGGEQQRVTIVRALANDPKILLLDEPTGDLDTKNSDMVMKILLQLNLKQKITMIMVTHDVQLKQFANRIVKISDGKIVGIEEIDKAAREKSVEVLRQIVDGEIKPEEGEELLGVRSGTTQNYSQNNAEGNQNQNQQQNSKTTYRKPGQYAVLDFAKQQRELQQQIQQA